MVAIKIWTISLFFLIICKHKGYNYKTKTLIQMFEITPEEQEQLRTLSETLRG